MRYIWTITIFCLITVIPLRAQVLKGKIVDEKFQPMPYVTVYVVEKQTGAVTNERGEFSIHLEKGSYTLKIQFMGYQTQTKKIELPLNNELKIKLEPAKLELKEVVINAKGEDPAYNIIRRVIAMGPYYEKIMPYSKSNVYIKGNFHLDRLPRLARKSMDTLGIKQGDVYLKECINEIIITPEKIEQRVISENSSVPSIFYDTEDVLNLFFVSNIYSKPTGELGLFSPVLPFSLSHYNYRLESSSIQEGMKIYHIKVIPKKENPMLYKGTIDIVDSLWCVSGFDFSGEIKMGILSMSLRYQQNYSELEKDVFQPVSYIIQSTGKMLGMVMRISNTAVIKYIDYTIDRPQIEDDTSSIPELSPFFISEKSKSYGEKINVLLSKEYISNKDLSKVMSLTKKRDEEDKKNNRTYFPEKSLEIKDTSYVFIVDSNAYGRDSTYWSKNRVAPLSQEEERSFSQKEEINLKIRRRDSLDKIENQFFDRVSSWKIKLDSLSFIHFNLLVDFNVVDGYLVGLKPSYVRKFRDSTLWETSLHASYAIESKYVPFTLSSTYKYFPEKQAYITLSGGRRSNDFNLESGMLTKLNSVSSLIFRKNYINFYDRIFFEIRHGIEVFNGFNINAGFNYEKQRELHNITDYSFFFRNSWDYRSNNPDNFYTLSNPVYLQDATGAIFDVEFEYTPEMYYKYEHRNKVNSHSKYPTFSFLWRKGIVDLFGSSSNFDQLQVGMKQQIKVNIFNRFDYNITGGWFPNNKSMHFSGFKHFTTPEFFLMVNLFEDNYHTLRSYSPSTNEWYLSGFFHYKTPYLAIKYLPFLDNTLISENVYASYLTTPVIKNYIELGYALTDIFSLGNIGFFVGFEDFKYSNWSVKVLIKLSDF